MQLHSFTTHTPARVNDYIRQPGHAYIYMICCCEQLSRNRILLEVAVLLNRGDKRLRTPPQTTFKPNLGRKAGHDIVARAHGQVYQNTGCFAGWTATIGSMAPKHFCLFAERVGQLVAAPSVSLAHRTLKLW